MPQGSILGPLLFIVYVNDITHNCIDSVPFIYADDTALLVTGSNKQDIETKLQCDLHHLGNWFNNNKLSLNVTKTKSMLICGSISKLKNESLNVMMNDIAVECVNDI